jgi:hypothetical protein
MAKNRIEWQASAPAMLNRIVTGDGYSDSITSTGGGLPYFKLLNVRSPTTVQI